MTETDAAATAAWESLRRLRGFLLDVDGVLCRGDELIPEANRAVEALRKRGKRLVFLSNNSTLSRKRYMAKLERLGIPVEPDELVLATYAAAQYVAKEKPGATVYMVGAPGLQEELELAGLQLTDDPFKAEYVVLGSPFDAKGRFTKENTDRITGALRALYHAQARYVAVNVDRIFPAPEGVVPGTGAVVGALNYMLKREPDVIAGKPSPLIVQAALDRLGLKAEECAIVGDSDTDIVTGRQTGLTTVLVLSGTLTHEDAERLSVKPDFLFKSLAAMVLSREHATSDSDKGSGGNYGES